MGNKLSLFEKRMININGDLQERVIYQRHMADDLFWAASGIVEKWIEIWASGIISEDYILTSPAKQVTSPHYSYSLDVDVIPDASGIRSLGSVDIPWTSGAFDELYVPSIINDVDVYGNVNVHGTIRQINYDEYDVIELNVSGDTKLGDGTDDTIDLVGTIISSSGNILINDSINPIASGTMDLGTISLAFDEAYIDKVYLEKDPVDPLGATTKQYVDAAVEVESFWDRAGTTIYPHNSGDDITTTGGIIIDSDSNGLYLGDELDGSITFNGNGLIIQSDGIAAGDYLQLRGGTNGIDFKIGGTEQLTLTDGALTPTASGTMNLGTVSLAYDDAYIDKVYLEDDPTTPLQAATKQYVDAAMASASPGGVDTNVQYNNSGILDGAADLTYNNVTSILTAIGFSGPLTGNSTTVTNGVYTTDFPLNQDTTGKADTAGNADTVTTNANLTGGVTSVGNAATVVTNANLTGGVTSVGNAATVVTNANLTGEVTSVGNAATIADSVTVTGWTMGTFSGTTYTGAVTGNCSGSSGSCTGLAATATALATGRTIGGVTFDGTANIVPTTIAVRDTDDASCYIGLGESASGDLLPKLTQELLIMLQPECLPQLVLQGR